MANSINKEMARGIAALVRGQRFSGSGVWRQSGTATLRIQTQTEEIVKALGRIPSVETQEEEERESDKQHKELVDAIEGTGTGTGSEGTDGKKIKGLKGLGASLKGLFGFLKPLALIFSPLKWLLKPITWLVGGITSPLGKLFGKGGIIRMAFFGLGGLVAAIGGLTLAAMFGFEPDNEEEAKKYFGDQIGTSAKAKWSLFVGNLAGDLINMAGGAWNMLMDIAGLDSLKITPEDQKRLQSDTIETISNTIFDIISFFEKLGKGFAIGFQAEEGEETLSQKGERLGVAIGNLGESLTKLGEKFQDIFKDVKFSFNHKERGEVQYQGIEGIGVFLGNVAYDLIGGLIDFATEIANFLTDPAKYISEVPGRILEESKSNQKRRVADTQERLRRREEQGYRTPLQTFMDNVFTRDNNAVTFMDIVGRAYLNRILPTQLVQATAFADPLLDYGNIIDNSTAVSNDTVIVNRILNSRGEKVVGEEKPIGK